MSPRIDRRTLMLATPGLTGLAILGITPRRAVAEPPAAPSPASDPWPGFHKNDPALVQKVVGAAHRDINTVRDLTERHPALVNAWWDWGFGDWESPLGAAAHTGRREIAELLISRGARVDIFAAAMLGWLDAVKAMVAALPGVQRTLGPHGITLLAHSRAGDEPSKAVVDYLTSLGDADNGLKPAPLADEDRAKYEGTYTYGPSEADRFTIRSGRQGLEFVRGPSTIRIHHLGNHEFSPSGAPAVRLRFVPGEARSVTITDHDLRVTASLARG